MSKLIKKYKNRQLYDVEEKSPITFGELAKGIEDGQDYIIMDNETEKDITLQTYAQVLYEEIKAGRKVKEYDEIIRQIAWKGGEKSMGVLKKTVLAGIGALSLSRKRATEIVEELIKQGELAEGQKAKAVKELMEKGEASAKEFTKEVQEQVKKAVGKIKGPAKDKVQELKDEIADLKARIKDLEEKAEE
jgi:polyhydroxyalkanoate synthesis regulator protein